MKKVLIVFGTRPEAIKMAPVIKKMTSQKDLSLFVCLTGQHDTLIHPVLDFFSIQSNFNLNIIDQKPSLTQSYALILERIEPIIKDLRPDLILVHGDTATTAAVAMAAFLNKIEVGHVEAGLRTGDVSSPWPEEFNRKLVSIVAKYHFAPTEVAKNNLINEGIPHKNIVVTGNTVIDALYDTIEMLNKDQQFLESFYRRFPFLVNNKKIVLVTMHRRENFGSGVVEFCETLRDACLTHDSIQIVFPVHLNPQIKEPVTRCLANCKNIFLVDPMDYCDFVYMMQKSHIIITDSGGVQEEAPSLGKPVLVTRETTERPEAVQAGTVRLVGTQRKLILNWIDKLLNDSREYLAMSEVQNPYGDGFASDRIISKIIEPQEAKQNAIVFDLQTSV